ncbi:MAG: DUF1838 family protein [Congregibacter sp.]
MRDKSDQGALVSTNSRRDFMQKAGIALGGGLAGMSVGQAIAMTSAAESSSSVSAGDATLKWGDNYWNRDAMARIQADLDFGKQKFGWYKGCVRGVVPGQKNMKLCGFEGFSFARLQDNGDGTYKKLLREVGYYTDLDTGEVLTEWRNPYTDELITNVVHIANDPFNYVIGPFLPKPPAYGGLNANDVPDIPLIMPWQDLGNGKVLLQRSIDLFYPSALQPDKWPRESPGRMTQVTEMFNYVFDKDDLADPSITGLEFSGSWNRLTPWLPWMLMGYEAEGHCHYDCVQGCYNNMDMLSPQVRSYAEEHHALYFNAPTEWKEPSLSSLENYALEQKPAPMPK